MDKNGRTGRRDFAQKKAAAVRKVRNPRAELGTDRGTANRVDLQLGYRVELLRSWLEHADMEGGVADGVTSDGQAEI